MRIVFMGTPDLPCRRLARWSALATTSLASTPSRRARPVAVLSRGNLQCRSLQKPKNCRCNTPPSLKSADEQARFKGLNADAAIVVAYGLILPKPILEAPRFGCFNLHASLLPRWRGAAPIQRAIMAGDTETASPSCAWRRDSTPAVCLAECETIGPDETAGELHDRLAEAGALLMVRALHDLEQGACLLAATR